MINNSIKIHPLWFVCISVRSIIFILPIIYYYLLTKNKNKELVEKISKINKYVILLMGLGFVYKNLFGSNNEIQLKKVFWHNTRIIHAFLFILAGLNFSNYKFSSSLLSSDVLFSIIYRFTNGHFYN